MRNIYWNCPKCYREGNNKTVCSCGYQGVVPNPSETMIRYSGVDASTTMFLWREFSPLDPVWTSHTFSELFPIQPPSLHEESPRYFYENVLKPLVPSMIDLMLNGIPLDMTKVDTLETRLDEILDKVKQDLLQNPIIQDFQRLQFTRLKQSKIDEYNSKRRDIRQYLKEYKDTDTTMRSYVVNEYITGRFMDFTYYPLDLLPSGELKWTVNDIKKLLKYNTDEFLQSIVDKTVAPDNEYVVRAMIDLARYKTELYNTDYDIKIGAIDISILPPFNPGSSKQLIGLFSFLEIEPLVYTPTGSPSWGRDQITEISYSSSNTDLTSLCKAIIDYSQASIIRSTFITAFNKYTVGGVLHGNIRIAGAKTYRPTSDKPNLLNLPSTGSIFAKPIKECMIAPLGKVIIAIDFEQLEDRVIANLTRDEGKCNIFLKHLDSHCYNSLGYFPDRVAAEMPLTGDKIVDTREYKRLIDEGNKALKAIRQDGKGVTFGISYGAFPPKIAATIKCPLSTAEQIFDSYHNELYPGITHFREQIVLKDAMQNGYIHMGLGAKMYSDDIGKNARTIFNSASQFWSILMLIAMAEIHQLIHLHGLENSIAESATVYDSGYFIVDADPVIIKWLNDHLIPIMTRQWIVGEIVHNGASIEVGTSWANLFEIPNNADLDTIQRIMNENQIFRT
jgi:hypothetical protein